MPKSIVLVPECHVDTALARTLVSGDFKLINHKHGISSVAKSMYDYNETYGNSRFVIGLVDGDKKFDDITYLREFRAGTPHLSCTATGCKFDIWQHPTISTQYLVVMDRACDSWIFHTASAAAINFSDHRLPSDFPSFLNYTKQKGVENKTELQGILKAIRKHNPAPYQMLSDFVDQLRMQTY